VLAPDQALPELRLPPLDARALARRAAIPALIAAAAVSAAVLAGAHTHAVADALRRALHADPGWAAVAVIFECISIAGYIGLLWLVAGRTAPRVGMLESAQITLTGAGATRLLPTAGAGGAAMTIWALRRAGLNAVAAVRTLLAFFVLLYAVFLAATAVFGAALTFGLVGSHGPTLLSAGASAVAFLGIVLCLVLAGLGDLRLAGAMAYWMFDAAVLWAMLSAFGSPPPLPVLGLAYLLGQVANTLPIPGSVSGGMTGVLIAWGVPAGLALPAVLAYRTIAVWLPAPAAISAIPGLRATLARWAREDAAAAERVVVPASNVATNSRNRSGRSTRVEWPAASARSHLMPALDDAR
jgi:uncharacterized membrane protein YbhN (UPF0104 family)